MSAAVCRASAIALTGLQGTAVMVEAAVNQQLPGMAIIGLPDAALAEAKLRVRTATGQVGLPLSDRFITVNLSPASLPKHGSGFDLAIALAALAASNHLPGEQLPLTAHIGELALDGGLRRPAGLLTAVLAARELGFKRVMVPESCRSEASLVPSLEIVAVPDLRSATAWYRGEVSESERASINSLESRHSESPAEHRGDAPEEDRIARTGGSLALGGEPDMSDVLGQPEAVEAMAVAAAGRHHISLIGPPGAGKTLLAMRLPSILPDLTERESLTASSIASLGARPLADLVRRPPFENPHHTASAASVIGGGQGGEVRPGAITRACHGVLFMDEAPEFRADVLEALREPLESGRVEIHRSRVRASLPARVQLVLAANPCPCGNAGSLDPANECRCTPSRRVGYLRRISGPLSDRIDLRLTLRRVPAVLRDGVDASARSSAELREHVAEARTRARVRLRGTPWTCNADVPARWLHSALSELDRSDTVVLDRALARGSLTMRGYDRTLRIAWTIADLSGKDRPERSEVARALVLRGGGAV